MITLIKIGVCALVAYVGVTWLCKHLFVRALKCTRCGQVIPEDEARAHDFKHHRDI
jgi:hypothetical protein